MLLGTALLLACGLSVFGRSLSIPQETSELNQNFRRMYRDWTSFLPKTSIAPSWISTLPDQPQLPSNPGSSPDADPRIASAIFSSSDTPDMSPTGTLLDTDSVIATSDFLGLLLDSPDVLQGSFEDMKNHNYRCCVYELSSDKRGLDLKSQSCGPGTSDWNASEDFKALKSLYRESKPGFRLFRVKQDTILSIMNFSYLTRTPKDEHSATSKPCRIQDKDTLPLLETQWADVLMHVFENADLFDQQ